MYAPIPENMASLVGASPTGRPANDIIKCPSCATFYAYVYTCGFTENDIELRRITPTEAGHDVVVDNYRRDLTSPHDDTRAYAAQCLVEYYLSEGMPKEADCLINHEDEIIRSSAEASKKYYLHRKSLD
jgi:hypothetical protein